MLETAWRSIARERSRATMLPPEPIYFAAAPLTAPVPAPTSNNFDDDLSFNKAAKSSAGRRKMLGYETRP